MVPPCVRMPLTSGPRGGKAVFDQAEVAVLDAQHLQPAVEGGLGHRTNHRVQAGAVAPGKNADAFGCGTRFLSAQAARKLAEQNGPA